MRYVSSFGRLIGNKIKSFLDLFDAPSSYSGKGGLMVKVKATEDGIEFGSGDGAGDVTGAASSVDSNIVEFNGTDGKVIKDSLLTHANTASAISLKHTQGTDQALDTGGANEITATNAKAAYTHSGVTTGNPHSVTKTEVGLSNCDNTTDADKPVSTATQTALNLKVTGAASSVDNTIPRFDSTTGKLIQTSGVGIGDTNTLTIPASGHLNLPQTDEAATPTIAFGDGDSGFYESTDDYVQLAIGGSSKWVFTASYLGVAAATYPVLNRVGTTATVPNLNPNVSDLDTGIGSAGADQLSLIAGGVEAMRLTEAAGVVQAIVPLSNTAATPTIAFGDGDTGFYEAIDDDLYLSIAGTSTWRFSPAILGSLSLSARLLAAAPSATVPSIIPVAGDANTGIGAAGADQLSLIAGGVEAMRLTEAAGLITNNLTGKVLTPTTQTLTTTAGAGAIDIVSAITHIVSTGVDALSLADGAEGQHKYIVMKTDGGDATLTPTSPGNFATILFDAVGDSAQLLFTNGKWHFMGGTATLS